MRGLLRALARASKPPRNIFRDDYIDRRVHIFALTLALFFLMPSSSSSYNFSNILPTFRYTKFSSSSCIKTCPFSSNISIIGRWIFKPTSYFIVSTVSDNFIFARGLIELCFLFCPKLGWWRTDTWLPYLRVKKKREREQ